MPILGIIDSSKIKTLYPAAYYAAIATSSGTSFYTYSGGNYDASGNYYINGFKDSGGVRYGWWAKISNTGTLLGSQQYTSPNNNTLMFGNSNSCTTNNSSADANGNLWIMTVGSNNSNGVTSGIAELNSSGAISSQRITVSANRSAANDYTYPQMMNIDRSNSKIYFGGATPNTSGGSGGSGIDGYLVKMGTNYSIDWQVFGFDSSVSASTRAFYFNQVQVDSSQNVYGVMYGQISTGAYMGEMIKFNSSGTVQWQRRFTGNYGSSDVTLIFGTTTNGTELYANAGYRNSSGGYDCAIFKFNLSTGALIWKRDLKENVSASSRYVSPREMVIDSLGNVYINAFYGSTYKSVIAKYNSSGTIQWIRSINSSISSNVAQGLDIDANDIITPTAYLGGGTHAQYLKIPNDGSKTGTYNTGGGTVTYSTTSDVYDDTSQINDSAGSCTINSGNLSLTTGTLTAQTFSPSFTWNAVTIV
jgi:hypothetical protein